MTLKNAKNLCYVVNTFLLIFVIALMAFFMRYKATYLVYFSVPTILFYIVNYLLIAKNKLDLFTWLVYLWIAVYMCFTTICLGFDLGFHLYSMSLIPVIFCTEYMGFTLNLRSIHPTYVSVGIALIDICSTGVAVINGPIYEVAERDARAMLVVNSVVVFVFLIFYTGTLLRMVMDSENKLKQMALVDKLTGLFNRHYMLNRLSAIKSNVSEQGWIAMIDIDNFKKINDTHGHNCGDYVLVHLGELIKEACAGCSVSRWGGEEFLVMSEDGQVDASVMQKLREKVSESPFCYQDLTLSITVTIGVAYYQEDTSVDAWIGRADDFLYYGKNHGKNQVVFEAES